MNTITLVFVLTSCLLFAAEKNIDLETRQEAEHNICVAATRVENASDKLQDLNARETAGLSSEPSVTKFRKPAVEPQDSELRATQELVKTFQEELAHHQKEYVTLTGHKFDLRKCAMDSNSDAEEPTPRHSEPEKKRKKLQKKVEGSY